MAQEAIVTQPAQAELRTIPFVEWLTVERAGYGLAVILALGVRLWGLGNTPLGPTEATQALPALIVVQGGTPDLLGGVFTAVSPLLYALQRVTFTLFGATDGTARFWPALLAGLSPLLFYFLRERVTRSGALVSAFLWAVSPLAVWSSRTGLGDGLVPTFLLAVLAAMAWSHRGRGWALSLGLAAGLLLISGSNAYTGAIAGLLALAWFAPQLREWWSGLRQQGRFALIGFGIALLLACFFFIEPAGLAAAGNLAGRWLSDLVPGTGEYGPLELMMRLLLSEPLVLAFAIAGFIWSLIHRDRFSIWLAAATGLALLVALVGRGRHPIDLAVVSLGITLLAGPAIARVLSNAYEVRGERDAWVLVFVSSALLIAASIAIPSALNMTNTADWRGLYMGVGIACLVMFAVVWIAYGVWDSWRLVGVTLPVVALVFGLAWQVGEMVSLNHNQAAWQQPAMVHEMPASNLVDLQKLLVDFGGLTGGGRDATVDMVWPNLASDPAVPELRWQLRDFGAARFSAALPADPARMVITPATEQPKLDGYSGQTVGVLQRWTPSELADYSAILRWVLYRESYVQPEKTNAIFWIKW